MHRELLPRLAAAIRQRTTRVAWNQWMALGWPAEAPAGASSLVDPEALVLASLGLVDHDRRLADALSWWSVRGSGLLSVQRIRNLAGSFPGSVRFRLKEFAGYARAAGDHRWKSVAGSAGRASEGGAPGAGAGGSGTEVAGEPPGAPRLGGPGASLLRLRLGLGVGIKADVVGALLGVEGWWRVRELSRSTGYSSRAVRRAAEELARGGWIAASPATPAEYRVGGGGWLSLLELESPAPWRDWAARYALVLAVDGWVREEEWSAQGLAEAESSAREVVEAHRRGFKWSSVALPTAASGGEGAYMRSFAKAADAVARRMEEEV